MSHSTFLSASITPQTSWGSIGEQNRSAQHCAATAYVGPVRLQNPVSLPPFSTFINPGSQVDPTLEPSYAYYARTAPPHTFQADTAYSVRSSQGEDASGNQPHDVESRRSRQAHEVASTLQELIRQVPRRGIIIPQREPTYYPGVTFRWRPADLPGVVGLRELFVAKSSAHVYLSDQWHFATLDLVFVLLNSYKIYRLQLSRIEYDSRKQPLVTSRVTEFERVLKRQPSRETLRVCLSDMIAELGRERLTEGNAATALNMMPAFSLMQESRVAEHVLTEIYK
jgi:hypothetical protein